MPSCMHISFCACVSSKSDNSALCLLQAGALRRLGYPPLQGARVAARVAFRMISSLAYLVGGLTTVWSVGTYRRVTVGSASSGVDRLVGVDALFPV